MASENIFESSSGPKRPSSTAGLILAAVTGGAAVLVSVIAFPFVMPAMRKVCLPYVPATTQQVHHVMKALAGRRKTGILVDLGSGDGRLVVAAAKEGFTAHGVELNSVLVAYSKIKAWKENVRGKTAFWQKDLWQFSLAPYENVVIFGVEEMMLPLQQKFQQQLKPNTRVIACRFPLPNWTPKLVIGEGIDTVWVYETASR